jgi:hypothetical protein
VGRRTLVGLALLAAVVLTGCSRVDSGAPATQSVTATTVIGASGPPADGDPNAAGRSAAAATASTQPTTGQQPAMPGGGMAICANETLGESMARAVDAGSSVVLATGGFTGTTMLADGEIGVPYSEVQLTVERTLGGPEVPPTLSAWVYGDLSATGGSATTGEASSLWARGGRMVAVVDTATQWSGLPGPVIRAAPVVGDELIVSWVGCWSTNGVTSREFDGSVEIFDERGLHPTDLQLFAVPLDEFAGLFAG